MVKLVGGSKTMLTRLNVHQEICVDINNTSEDMQVTALVNTFTKPLCIVNDCPHLYL